MISDYSINDDGSCFGGIKFRFNGHQKSEKTRVFGVFWA